MLAADSDATGCIKMMLDNHDEFQQNETTYNDTPDSDINVNSSGDDVDGVPGAQSTLTHQPVSFDPRKMQEKQFSVDTKDDNEDNVLCRAIRNGKR